MIATVERWVDQLRTVENSIGRLIAELSVASPDLDDVQRVLTQSTQARVSAEKLALRLTISARQSERSVLQAEIDDLQSKLSTLP
jgi:transcriptional regulator GlxA family with amidase domain